MITLTPIYRDGIQQAGKEFFDPTYVTERLGRDGHWHGSGARILQLANPVQHGALESLLQRAAALGPPPSSNRASQSAPPVGWRLTFTTPPRLNTFWAMSDRAPALAIEKEHALSVKQALHRFESLAGSTQIKGLQQDQSQIPGCVFATFRTGASADRAPELLTTAFLINLAVQADGRHRTFATEQIARAHKSIGEFYESSLIAGVGEHVGPMSRYSHRDQPLAQAAASLAASILHETEAGRSEVPTRGPTSKVQQRGRQFVRWRRQGEQIGWGPKQAQAYLRDLQCKQARARLGNAIRGQLQKAVQAVRRILPPAPPRIQVDQAQPAPRPQQKEQGYTHSH